MRKFVLTIFLFFLLLLRLAEAQGVSLYLPTSKLVSNVGETKSINVTIKNLQNVKDIFSVLIWPPIDTITGVYSYIQPRIELSPGEEITIPLTFVVPECTIERNLLFEITVSSLTTPAIKDEKTLTLVVKGEGLSCITGIEMNKIIFDPGEEVKIDVTISNYDKDRNFVVEVLVKRNKEIKKSFSENIFLKNRETKKLEYRYLLEERALAGDYNIGVLLKGDGKVISSRESKFSVKAIEKLDFSHLTKNFIVLQVGSIKIKNLGNTLSKPTTQSLVTPWFMKIFFYSPLKLLEEKTINGQVVYSWTVPSLNPLEEYEIKYEFRFWPVWMSVVLVILLIVFTYLKLYSIEVVKRTKPVGILKMGREIPVSISLVNNSLNELKDILVKDLVPPIATVSEKFETLKPVKRKIRAGTELNWRISSLKPGEEVILSYRIIPIVDIVGTLMLPKATVSFVSKGEKKRIIVSKPIVIAPT